ncbi:aminotransferase class I/II-fold pyridoxal phosphate-dependent enzyme [Blastococcus sp. SYSU DS0973]
MTANTISMEVLCAPGTAVFTPPPVRRPRTTTFAPRTQRGRFRRIGPSSSLQLVRRSDSPPADAAGISLVWLNSPGNPHGRALTDDQLRAWVAWGRAHGVPVVVDECYLTLGWDVTPRSILHPAVAGEDYTGLLAVHSLSEQSTAPRTAWPALRRPGAGAPGAQRAGFPDRSKAPACPPRRARWMAVLEPAGFWLTPLRDLNAGAAAFGASHLRSLIPHMCWSVPCRGETDHGASVPHR